MSITMMSLAANPGTSSYSSYVSKAMPLMEPFHSIGVTMTAWCGRATKVEVCGARGVDVGGGCQA
ncbi:MAG: hypothetical protein DI549_09400 [Ancylobacter novellus]|uniref:Uncharacterized protein n=1 Tax=Ancylobacter novellus TaxID=921 RepID=A0A2W5SJN5_ANCNO|nr:MAG: hypothetical protein DI549_09400 [Ancylobacter novellus]